MDQNSPILSKEFVEMLNSLPGNVVAFEAKSPYRILYMSRETLSLLGVSSLEDSLSYYGESLVTFAKKQDRKGLQEVLETLSARGWEQTRLCFKVLIKGGKEETMDLIFRRKGDLAIGFLVSAIDANYAYDIDNVTRLMGKRRFLIIADSRRANHPGSEYALLFIDLVNFNLYNVKHGLSGGDSLLTLTGSTLSALFPDDFISRFNEDHFFIFLENKDIESKVKVIYEELGDKLKSVDSDLRIGAYFPIGKDEAIESACEKAKIAGDSITLDYGHAYYAAYDEEKTHRDGISSYIAHHIEEAIANHYIKVYYQPVIRAISGKLCGFEALTRWEDPKLGVLPPAAFIPVLEETRQIHKLDSFVIEEVCARYEQEVKAGRPVVPVSFNLSRQDFLYFDVFQKVERSVLRHNVPRDMISVEITESMLSEEPELINEAVDKFHSAGYQVWMDDFGSGYSSLNILKDYSFDELKIDMAFLRHDSAKGRQIIAAIIKMAKVLHVQTLTEGVETKEQFEFLRSIGCEKIQGYYFGKPYPFEEAMASLKEKGIEVEPRSSRRYFDAMGGIDFDSDVPMALIEKSNDKISYFFANDSYKKVLSRAGVKSLEDDAKLLNRKENKLHDKYLSFLESLASRMGEEAALVYPYGDRLLRIYGKALDSHNGNVINLISLTDVTPSEVEEERRVNEGALRNLYLLYDEVRLLRVEKDTSEELLDVFKEKTESGLEESNASYCRNYIFPEDQARYLEFSRLDNLQERLDESPIGFLDDYFRTKDRNGNYAWKVHNILAIPSPEEQLYLHTVKKAEIEDKEVAKALFQGSDLVDAKLLGREEEPLSKADIFDNLMEFGHLHYFYKDKCRRFLGASQSFLRYYGFRSVDEILGKTDEDMGWHVDEAPFKNDELEVLNKGKTFLRVPGECIIKGVLHHIRACKFPIYRHGKICGIFGYFVDEEDQLIKGNKAIEVVKDKITGLTNARGFFDELLSYQEDALLHESKFAVITVAVPNFSRYVLDYGEKAGEGFLRLLGDTLLRCANSRCAIARLSGSTFALLYKYKEEEQMRSLLLSIVHAIQGIHECEGNPCTAIPKVNVIPGSYSHLYSSIGDILMETDKKKN